MSPFVILIVNKSEVSFPKFTIGKINNLKYWFDIDWDRETYKKYKLSPSQVRWL